MPESPAHAASLTVLAGPFKGRRLVVDEAIDDVLIGSDPDCRLCLDVPGVSPIHARIWLDPEGATLYDTHSAGGVYVNDDRVVDRAALHDGDVIWLGPPAEPASVMLQFRHPTAKPRAPAPPPAVAAAPAAAAPARAPAPAPEPVVLDDQEWLIEEVGEPAAPAASGAHPLESVLEDEDLEWPPPAPPAPPAVAAPPPAMEPQDDFFVAEEPPAPPQPQIVDEDLFEWGAPADAAAASPSAAQDESPQPVIEADVDPLLLDWTTPAEPAPTSSAAMTPPAPVPGADDDVFFVEDAEPVAPVASPPPPPPVISAPPPVPARPPVAEPPPMVFAPPPPVAAPPRVPAPTPSPSPEPPPIPMRMDPVAPSLGAAAPAPRPPRHAPHEPSASRPPFAAVMHSPRAAAEARGKRMGGKRALLLVGGLVLALAIAGLIATQVLGTPRVEGIEPSRVRTGDTIVVTGRNFSSDAAAVVVRFEGKREGRILRASPTRLEVEVPAIPTAPGRANRVPVQVVVSGRESRPFEIAVYQAPRIHGIAPSVALPGEEVTLAGADWGPGASVRFGTQEAPIVELAPNSIRVRVPAVNAPEGTRLPVVVSMGGDPSNEMPFHLGRLPLLLSVEPRTVSIGDSLVIKGMGFAPQPSANDLRVGGARAIVVRASESELVALVPRTPAEGQNAVELRVPGSDRVGQSTLTLAPLADPVEFRFIVEHPAAVGIKDPENGHDHVVLSTGLGPAFLISATQSASAAERGAEAQRRLNEAAVALKASLTSDLEVRGLDGEPSIALVGKQEPLLVVTPEDAAAYDEDWARGRGKGETVTAARLAIWWGAVARDLVLLLVRGDRPRYAAALAPEGRALGALHDFARRTGRFGVPREAVTTAPAALREGLRAVALRVPAAVKAPEAAAAAAAPPVQALALEGIWTGTENEGGTTRYMTVTFAGQGGTFTYERALSMTIPLQTVEQPNRKQVKFGFRSGMRMREYDGTWDGQKLRGKIVGEDGAEIGSFELEHKR